MNSTYRYSLAGSVILYNPDYDVPDNVASYLNTVDRLYVVDNQNGKAVAERIAALAPEKVTVISNPENEGIAKPLNTVLQICRDKYDLLITMDQDSRFFPGTCLHTALVLIHWIGRRFSALDLRLFLRQYNIMRRNVKVFARSGGALGRGF